MERKKNCENSLEVVVAGCFYKFESLKNFKQRVDGDKNSL